MSHESTTDSPGADEATRRLSRAGWSLGAHFAVLVGLFVAVAAGAAAYVSLQTEHDAQKAALRTARAAASSAAKQLAKDVALVKVGTAGLAANPGIAQAFTQPKGCTLQFGGSGTFTGGHLDVLRPDGTVACTSRATPWKGYADAAWWDQAQRGPVFLAPVRDPASGREAILSTAPIPGGGVVATFATLASVGPGLEAMFDSGGRAEFLVTDAAGRTVLARSSEPRRWVGKPVAETPFDPASSRSDRRDLTGKSRFYREATVPGVAWRLFVGEDRAAALAPGVQLRNRELAIIGGGLVVVLLAALLIYRRVALPIKRLAGAVRAADPYARDVEPLTVSGPAEINALSADVERLVGSIGRELHERRQLEEQLRHAQKMDALGRVAAGVAHDFNNLVTIITGFTSLILKSAREDATLRGHAHEVGRAAERAAVLIRQLLLFSRKEKVEPTTLDANGVVSEMEGMLSRILGERIELEARLGAAPATVSADRGQLEQVLLNLAVNARDAMRDGGTLTLSTASVELDPDGADLLGLEPGRYLTIAVADTGTGMDARTQARLFEPFFTTKPAGEGTGLGLATCYGIVSELGGKIAVESEPGRGSLFTLYLPSAAATAEQAAAPSAQAPRTSGGKTVLVVEDDPNLRALVKTVLEEAGYVTLEARFGEEAIWVADHHESPIDLLLTDSVMPVMSGPELAERFLELHREARVVYMSGYGRTTPEGAQAPEDRYLAKPFTPEQLVAKVRAAVAD